MIRDELRDELLATDDGFRRLHEEHQECERRLDRLASRSLLSQEDEMEEKRMKLHKLALKDRMERMLHERANQQVTV